ncbi:hypothetical protein BC829DRAFT_447224 [Chytridium lagenaria]|nr:hypothetical protein BC829DRAFT_447224 [Chytridium lagenaria]
MLTKQETRGDIDGASKVAFTENVNSSGAGAVVTSSSAADYTSQITALNSDRHLVLLDLILHGLRHGRSPEYIHFNMVLNDYCCLSIPDFGRVFPPATGYSFLCWFQVGKFDSKSEIPILHMVDGEDKTRLKIVIESLPSSRKIRVETFKTTVRFDSAVIKEGEWYHLAVVHQKPRMTASTIDVSKIRTFFGVSPEMAHSERSQSIWNIGPSYFIEETLLDAERVKMISNIGFEYSSNFQGSFSKYQTHEILNTLSIDGLSSKGDIRRDNSTNGPGSLPADRIVSSEKVTTPTTNLLALMLSQVKGPNNPSGLEVVEDKILFSVTAKNSLEVRLRDHINEINSNILLLAERLNPQARVLLSQSSPKIAIDQNYSPVVTLIKGNPLFVCPQRVIDGIWKLGGCSILLMLVDRSETSEALFKSTAAVVESIRYNWRNTDDMERNEFYEILSSLLSRKTHFLTIATIDVLLSLIGRNLHADSDPIITNVTAVKHLFIDGFLWKAPFDIKKYFLSQFSEFVAHSGKRAYNVRKLNRLGMAKKLLLLIQAQIITDDLLPDVIVLLKAFLKANFSVEAVRGAAWRSRSNTYSTRAANIANINKLTIEARRVIPKLIVDAKANEGKSRNVLLRNQLLEVLLDLINDSTGEYALQFANIITSRWILLFFNKNLDLYTVVLASRILSRLCLTQNPSYSPSKFREGFLILGSDLSESALIVDVYPSLFSILCGSDVNVMPLGSEYLLGNMLELVRPADLTKKRNFNPDLIRIIILMMRKIVEMVYDENGKSLRNLEGRFRDIQDFLGTTLDIIVEMYLAADDVKEVICRPEVIDEIIAMIFPIVMMVSPLSIEGELITQHSVQIDGKENTPRVDIKEIPPTAHPNSEAATPASVAASSSSTTELGDRSAHTPSPITPLKSIAKRISLLLSALNTQELSQAEETTDPIAESALELILALSVDSIMGTWKPLQGIDIIMKDITSFLSWVDSKREELSILFQESASKAWESYTASEQRLAKENLKLWTSKRCSKLKKALKKNAQDRETVSKYRLKTNTWINEMQNLEASRLYRYKSDLSASQTFVDADWAKVIGSLTRERALWGLEQDGNNRWKLDFVEGRARMRKKLRRNTGGFVPYLSKHEKLKADRVESAIEKFPKMTEKTMTCDFTMDAESLSPPDCDPGVRDDSEIELEDFDDDGAEEPGSSSGSGKDHSASEEDKNRKILRLLDAGDTVLETFNSARVLGLDICGELVDIDTVPSEERNIYHVMLESQSGKKLTPEDGERYFCRRWNWDDVREVHKRLFLARGVALEIFLGDGRNYILTFLDTKTRDVVYNRIVAKATNQNNSESVVGVNASAADPLTVKTFSNVIFGGSALADLTQKWTQREISNFQYLIHLNTLAGRSYNDLTQYPVFPWILADYESEELDLQRPETFRDLSKPMGAQGEGRAEKFQERFQLWDDPVLPPCHYGTHYSSAMIVCSYLIRLEPFTQQYLKLQGGHFDHPDRLFHSIGKSWASASKEASTDVRELIPEFFFLPEFLQNLNKFDFGKKQTGEDIDDILLPPWAKGDPRLFILKHREALESEYVSAHLHEWIDLIFGFRQTGEEAVKAQNVFHYLSYEGAVDMDNIEDHVEKQATIGIIHNFGQTPRQLFKKPHPRRGPENINEYRISKNPDFLIHTSQPIRTVGNTPIGDIKLVNDKLYAVGWSKAFFPGNPSRTLEWDYLDNSLRLMNDSKVVAVFENLHIGHITWAAFVDQNKIVTSGSDTTLCIWRYRNRSKRHDLQLLECLRGHRGKVLTFAVSKTFSLVASGGTDRLVILWDLIRKQYTRALPEHDGPIRAIAINENTGDITTCTDLSIYLWTINGDPIASKSILVPISDCITSCAFYEGRICEQLDTCTILTGHKKGSIKIWRREMLKKPQQDSPGIEIPAEASLPVDVEVGKLIAPTELKTDVGELAPNLASAAADMTSPLGDSFLLIEDAETGSPTSS